MKKKKSCRGFHSKKKKNPAEALSEKKNSCKLNIIPHPLPPYWENENDRGRKRPGDEFPFFDQSKCDFLRRAGKNDGRLARFDRSFHQSLISTVWIRRKKWQSQDRQKNFYSQKSAALKEKKIRTLFQDKEGNERRFRSRYRYESISVLA